MTSHQALQLATIIIQNDLTVAGPLLRLLYAFTSPRGDPLTEAMRSDVTNFLYTKTEHCQAGIIEFVKETEDKTESLAA